jgi:hypothetical protein
LPIVGLKSKKSKEEFLLHGFSLALTSAARRRLSDGAIGQEKPPDVSDKTSTNDYKEQLSRLF